MTIKKKNSRQQPPQQPINPGDHPVTKRTNHTKESESILPRLPATTVFPIVGVGASAGGLAAFEAFFAGMPADIDSGMAFVLVQHLDPNHKSILTELIRRYTRMQVFEVEDGMKVQPNCTYIIPPGRDMAFLNGTLQLLDPVMPRGQRMPIDFFFRSLAQNQREHAIGVVLSGSGSDGTLGIRAIKGEGGMVMAQSPESTEYDGMPRSALSTGLVDFQMLPVEMPAQLMAFASQAFFRGHRLTVLQPAEAENALKKIFVLLRAQTGHDFSGYKTATIDRRLERRMAIDQIETLDGYVKYLQQSTSEVEALFRDLLIGVTNFFRDPAAFKVLEEQIVPQLLIGKQPDNAIRVWVPGCSTGEEAYSIAILLSELQKKLDRPFRVQVFAGDIDNRAIAVARAGLYPASIAADISPERLSRFFTAEPGGSFYRIHKDIRDMLIFSEQDIIKDPPFSKLDLISCRNLMIYFNSELQKKIIPMFHYSLNPRGFLFLGSSETIGEFVNLFATVDRRVKLYQRKGDTPNLETTLPNPSRLAPTLTDISRFTPKIGATVRPHKTSLRELTERALLQHIPAAVLVDKQGDILFLHGRTGRYLEPTPGEAGINNILKMAREGLGQELTTALYKSVTRKIQILCPNIKVKTNGDFTIVNLTIQPISSGSTAAGTDLLYLVIFLEADKTAELEEKIILRPPEPGSDAEKVIATLREELQSKEEYLQTTLEQVETSNEELKSSNEELQSVNEELQSTNEELETSKEELQSVNEELATVNNELQTKVADLSQANNDMNNLLAGTGIGTVFVDHGLRILRFTPTATRMINLIPGDLNRQVGHIVSNLIGYNSLVTDIETVLQTLMPKEIEVQTTDEKWFSMRIQPYRTLDNVIEGAVITFMEITELAKIRKMLELATAGSRSALSSRAGNVTESDDSLG